MMSALKKRTKENNTFDLFFFNLLWSNVFSFLFFNECGHFHRYSLSFWALEELLDGWTIILIDEIDRSFLIRRLNKRKEQALIVFHFPFLWRSGSKRANQPQAGHHQMPFALNRFKKRNETKACYGNRDRWGDHGRGNHVMNDLWIGA